MEWYMEDRTMEWCIEDAKGRRKKYWNNWGAGGFIIFVIIGFVGLIAGIAIEDMVFGGIIFAVYFIAGIFLWIIFAGIIANVQPKFEAERSIIKQYSDNGRSIDGVVVGRAIAYIPAKSVLRASGAAIKMSFVVYDYVFDVTRNARVTVFTMIGGKKQSYLNVDLSQAAYEEICKNIRAWKNGEVSVNGCGPDIVYEDNNDGGYGSGGYDSDSGYSGGLLG